MEGGGKGRWYCVANPMIGIEVESVWTMGIVLREKRLRILFIHVGFFDDGILLFYA